MSAAATIERLIRIKDRLSDREERDAINAACAALCAVPVMRDALEMVRDADRDCEKDGKPTMPRIARGRIDHAISTGDF